MTVDGPGVCFYCLAPNAPPRDVGDRAPFLDVGRYTILMHMHICDNCWSSQFGDSRSRVDSMRESTKRYVLTHGPPTPLRSALADEWPLPIGAAALSHWACRRPAELTASQCQDLEDLADIAEGFPPDEFVGLVEDLMLERGHIRLFGTAIPGEEDLGGLEREEGGWLFGEPIVQATTWPGGQGDIRKGEAELRTWYRDRFQRAFGWWGARPVGSVSKGPTDEERAAYVQACAELAPQDRGPTAVATRMGAILNRAYMPGWVHYWMEKGAFPRDDRAPRRARGKREHLSK